MRGNSKVMIVYLPEQATPRKQRILVIKNEKEKEVAEKVKKWLAQLNLINNKNL